MQVAVSTGNEVSLKIGRGTPECDTLGDVITIELTGGGKIFKTLLATETIEPALLLRVFNEFAKALSEDRTLLSEVVQTVVEEDLKGVDVEEPDGNFAHSPGADAAAYIEAALDSCPTDWPTKARSIRVEGYPAGFLMGPTATKRTAPADGGEVEFYKFVRSLAFVGLNVPKAEAFRNFAVGLHYTPSPEAMERAWLRWTSNRAAPLRSVG